MATPKEMLSALLTRGQLDRRHQETFEGMWDAVHRYGSLSNKQKAWVEREFYERKLDRSDVPPPAALPAQRPRRVVHDVPKRPGSGTYAAVRTDIAPTTASSKKHYRIGYINYSGTDTVLMVTNMAKLKELCPSIRPGTPQYAKIEAFFRKGGEVLKIKPSGNRQQSA